MVGDYTNTELSEGDKVVPEMLLVEMALYLMAYKDTFKPYQIGFQSLTKILNELEQKTGIKTS